MALKIRLKQTGKRNARAFRIVAVDESKKRDGKVVETLGFIQKLKTQQAQIDSARLKYWVSVGAQVTPAVKKLLKS